MDKEDIRLNIRISRELKEAIREQAKKEGRTIAGLVIYVMRQYLERQLRPKAKRDND